jgi:hypothetical protein
MWDAQHEQDPVDTLWGLFHAQVLARPEGFEHAPPTMLIEGVEELVEALRAAY